MFLAGLTGQEAASLMDLPSRMEWAISHQTAPASWVSEFLASHGRTMPLRFISKEDYGLLRRD